MVTKIIVLGASIGMAYAIGTVAATFISEQFAQIVEALYLVGAV